MEECLHLPNKLPSLMVCCAAGSAEGFVKDPKVAGVAADLGSQGMLPEGKY